MGDIAGTVYERPGTRNFWLKFYIDGKPIRESSGTADRDEALKKLKSRISESKPKDKRTISVVLDGLIEDYKINDKSVEWAELVVEKHLRPFFGAFRAEKLTKQDIRAYILARKSKGRKNATINRELALLHRSYNLADIPFPRVQKLEENNVRKGFQSPQSFAQILNNLPQHLRPIAVFAYETGCRRGEILNLKWSQVDLDNAIVRLEAGETKNGEARAIPLSGTVIQALRYLPRDSEYVFTYRGKRIKSIRSGWTRACAKAGSKGVLFHDLRRTAVRNLSRARVPERVIMSITGHKTRSVFDRYNIVDENDLHDGMNRLQEMKKGNGVRFENFLKGPLDDLFGD
jgi:integrase